MEALLIIIIIVLLFFRFTREKAHADFDLKTYGCHPAEHCDPIHKRNDYDLLEGHAHCEYALPDFSCRPTDFVPEQHLCNTCPKSPVVLYEPLPEVEEHPCAPKPQNSKKLYNVVNMLSKPRSTGSHEPCISSISERMLAGELFY